MGMAEFAVLISQPGIDHGQTVARAFGDSGNAYPFALRHACQMQADIDIGISPVVPVDIA